MKIHYDPEVDAMTIALSEADVETSEEVAPSMIIDQDADDQMIAIEILDTTKYGRNIHDVHFEGLFPERAHP